MTTVDTAAAWRLKKPVTQAALAVILVLGLAGCETGSNLLGSLDQSAPQTAVAPPTAPAATTQQHKIAIAPVIGAPEAVAKQFNSQLTGSLERQKAAVASSVADKPDYTLRGYVVSAREKAGVKVSYIWDVTDAAGKRVNRITGEEVVPNAQGKDPWSAVSPALVQTIADKTAGSVASWLATQAQAPVASATTTGAAPAAASGNAQSTTQVAATAPPAASASGVTPVAATGSIGGNGAVSAVVPSVTGAPGDGSLALTSALQRELTRNGVSLVEAPNAQSYRVQGKVSVGQGKDGKQPIRIDWSVIDPNGKNVGTVSQKNEIPQGSLDGSWGKTADAAAAAAAQGILKLLPQGKVSTN